MALPMGLRPITSTYVCTTPTWANHNAAIASAANKMLLSLKNATTIFAVSSCRAGEESLRDHPLRVWPGSHTDELRINCSRVGQNLPYHSPCHSSEVVWAITYSQFKSYLNQLETSHWGSSSQKAMQGWRRHSLICKDEIFLLKGCSTEGVGLSWSPSQWLQWHLTGLIYNPFSV